jgi:hypothetical protein
MKGFIFVSDAARAHPDGTFSLLRGGIDRIHTPSNQPIQFRGAIVARMTGTMNEAGPHEFKIRILNEDGQPVAPDIQGSVNVPEGGGAANIVGEFALMLPRDGRYTFSLSVDRHEIDTWEVRADVGPPQTSGD